MSEEQRVITSHRQQQHGENGKTSCHRHSKAITRTASAAAVDAPRFYTRTPLPTETRTCTALTAICDPRFHTTHLERGTYPWTYGV
ncbi:hypothetical protein J6590_081432 [Homalodisca vitripennis]|nr:hypothetical protein J6590_081432 [Homalodisca vitripennis]